MTSTQHLKPYITLIHQFVNKQITATEFETSFTNMFKNETYLFSEEVFQVLNRLFTDVDAYCDDDELCDEDDLNDEQLYSCAEQALEHLKSLSH